MRNTKWTQRVNDPRLLAVVAASLVLAVGFQLWMPHGVQPQVRMAIASWKDVPKTVEQATKLADEVVEGRVTNIRRAEDLVVKLQGLPGGEDRIPIEIVTITVDHNHKGQAKTIELFHVGGSTRPPRSHPAVSEAPPKPPGGVERSTSLTASPAEDPGSGWSVTLHDDPGYKTGERYLLFTRKGPQVRVGSSTVQTQAMVSPTGRFRILGNNVLDTVTREGFANEFKGRKLSDLQTRIRK